MIVFSSVSKIFEKTLAVNNVTFSIKQGEIVGLLGPNGAGKTTTMRLITGTYLPTKGEILINDKNPIEDRIKVLENIGYLAENNPLYPDLTVREYLSIVSSIKKGNKVLDSDIDMGIDMVIDKKIGSLSRGYRQRVGLVASLIGNPSILILDEPTSGLDPIEQDNLLKMIVRLKSKRTIIISTHILSEVEKVATRLLIMSDGQIRYDGKKPIQKGAVEKLFRKSVKNN